MRPFSLSPALAVLAVLPSQVSPSDSHHELSSSPNSLSPGNRWVIFDNKQVCWWPFSTWMREEREVAVKYVSIKRYYWWRDRYTEINDKSTILPIDAEWTWKIITILSKIPNHEPGGHREWFQIACRVGPRPCPLLTRPRSKSFWAVAHLGLGASWYLEAEFYILAVTVLISETRSVSRGSS